MRGKAHSDETRAAVMAALVAGQGVEEIADDYDLPVATVKTWNRQVQNSQLIQVQPKNEDEFGTLLGTYLRETLITLAAQQSHFRDKKWLSTQSASELAVLHGVSADKAIRLFEAAERAADAARTADNEPIRLERVG